MKILMVDKFYFVKGGAERYMFELSKVLEANGHEVIPFAMRHPDSFETQHEAFFARNIEYNHGSVLAKVATAVRAAGKNLLAVGGDRHGGHRRPRYSHRRHSIDSRSKSTLPSI